MAAVAQERRRAWCRVVPGPARARAQRRRPMRAGSARARTRWKRCASLGRPANVRSGVRADDVACHGPRRPERDRRPMPVSDGRSSGPAHVRRSMSTADSAESPRPARAAAPHAGRRHRRHQHQGVGAGPRRAGWSPSRCARQPRSPRRPKPCCRPSSKLAARLPPFDRISVGFPGVVKGGTAITAPNLGTEHWAGFRLIETLSQALRRRRCACSTMRPCRAWAWCEGQGLECVLTLGTGVGCALFRDRRLLLHLELGQHRARKGKTYDQYIGQAALAAIGPERGTGACARRSDTVLRADQLR